MTRGITPGRRTGRRPPHPEITHPRLRASRLLKPDYVATVPPVVDWSAGIAWPVFLNNDLGDCTIADVGHAVEVFTLRGQGQMAIITDADVLTMYKRVGGYQTGHPDTDNGCVIQDVLSDWRKNGIGSPAHRILAFLQVDHTDLDEVKACLWWFGGVTLGVNLPQSAYDQMDAGRPWDYDPRANNRIIGGHDVRIVAIYANGDAGVVTWGQLQRVTSAWMARYADEAWAQADPEWVKNGRAADGLDITALNAAFTRLTGEPGPFPAGPVPVVPPSPTPVTPVSDADKTLAASIPADWLAHPLLRFSETAAVARSLQNWLTATGLRPATKVHNRHTKEK